MLHQIKLNVHRTRRMFLVLLLAALQLPLLAAPLAQAGAAAAPAQPQALDSGLVGYWPFELGSADADLSGSGNTAAFGNGMGLTSVVPPTPFANQTALLSSLSPTSYATAPGNRIDNLQQFTIAFWLRMNTLPSNNQVMSLVSIPNKVRIEYVAAGTQHDFFFYIQGNSVGRGIYFGDIQPGVYYHIAATYGANGMSVYVNGQLKNSLPGFVAPVQGAGVAFSSPTTPLDGYLDDVRIYDRSLPQGEVASMSFRCANVSELPQAECQALVDLYNSAGGPQWTNQTNWMLNNTPCTWYGVLCNNGHVFLLVLSNNGLSGVLPLSLNDLTGLASLGLNGNNLSGPIPPLLSGLTQLQAFDLSNNHLSGGLPALLGRLPGLHTLNLSNNALSGDIAPLITNLNQLTSLNLSYNALNPTDSGVRAFLTSLQPAWAATQTVPPASIHAQSQSSTSAALTWTPIAYTADGGYYEVFASNGNGQYTSVGKTADKTASGINITGLQAGTTYSFLVRTFTPKHSGQPNDVTSDTSDPITVMPANQAPATITIALDVQPDSATNFRFDGSLGTFLLDDITPSDGDAYSSSKTFSVAAGTYTVIENVPNGWSNANISCNPPANTIADLAKNQIVINAASGANITCTFVTQRAGQLIGGSYNDRNHNHKQDRNDAWLAGWAMQIQNNSSLQLANQPTNQTGRATFTNLRPGSYTICETVQSGWFNITPGSINPAFNQPCYTVTVAPGMAIWARFGNSTTPLAAALAGVEPFSDIVVCDLVSTDDLGNPTTAERDPWEEEEDAARGKLLFLSLVMR